MKIYITLFLCLFTSLVFGQTNTTTPTNVTIPENLLTEQQKAYLQQNKTIDAVNSWVGMGKEVGEAFNGALGALTHHAVDFSKTDLGKFTMFLIAYKVMGTDIIQLFIGIPIAIILTIMFIFYYFRNCTNRRFLSKETKEGEKIYEIYEPNDGLRFVPVLIYAILMAFTMLIIFA